MNGKLTVTIVNNETGETLVDLQADHALISTADTESLRILVYPTQVELDETTEKIEDCSHGHSFVTETGFTEIFNTCEKCGTKQDAS